MAFNVTNMRSITCIGKLEDFIIINRFDVQINFFIKFRLNYCY